MVDIILTESACSFLKNSLRAENLNEDSFCIYIYVMYPNTKYSHVNITFCSINDVNKDDFFLNIKGFNIYLEKNSLNLLNKSVIDCINGSLFINAPSILNSSNLDSSDLKNKIKYLFENEVNVILSQHGGFIELVDLVNDVLMIKFHGGCQGCGMVGYTLNNYIEKMIKKNFPNIKNIKDVTSHDIKDYAYF